MAQQIQLRRDTAANWTSANPTLAQGEIGLETDTHKFKIGDGVTAWNSLGYASAIPSGGTSGQVLKKNSNADFDLTWLTLGSLATVTAGTGVATAAAVNLGSAGALAALAQAQTFTAAQRGAFVTLTDAATVALDLSLANQYILNIGGSRTLGVPTNIVAGQQGVIIVRQDATGSRTLAYAWPYEWFGGTAGVLSTPGCSRDMLAYSVDAYNSGTVTITIAAPGVVSMTAHGFLTGQRCQIATTGALPTGLATGTTYFISVVDANSFKLCTSLANAAAGTFITTSGSQSGVHTLTGCSITLNLSKAAA